MNVERRLKRAEKLAPANGPDDWRVVFDDPAEYQRLIAEGVPEERI